jgi:hypothetical protein
METLIAFLAVKKLAFNTKDNSTWQENYRRPHIIVKAKTTAQHRQSLDFLWFFAEKKNGLRCRNV